jgi:hypothetical protein
VLFLILFIVCRLEAEFDAKLKALEEKHAKEIDEIMSDAVGSGTTTHEDDVPVPVPVAVESSPITEKTAEEIEREKKQAKARQKREKAKQKELERELEIERENANAGPSLRQLEMERIQQQLIPLSLEIVEIPSDGHCLYRAIAAHCGSSYQETRKLYRKFYGYFPGEIMEFLFMPSYWYQELYAQILY